VYLYLHQIFVSLKLVVKNLNETITFSRKLANCCAQLKSSFVIYLIGELGVGKTALAQGFIQYFGFEQVKSPTYSLVESYQNDVINIHHMDCYRLNDPEELEYIGIRDYLSSECLQLIEWPELGKGVIAKADISITLSGDGNQRKINIQTHTTAGKEVIKCAIT
jgi:tRNA threonylcarbamoyladenosine biosynthesis protein TsaE